MHLSCKELFRFAVARTFLSAILVVAGLFKGDSHDHSFTNTPRGATILDDVRIVGHAGQSSCRGDQPTSSTNRGRIPPDVQPQLRSGAARIFNI